MRQSAPPVCLDRPLAPPRPPRRPGDTGVTLILHGVAADRPNSAACDVDVLALISRRTRRVRLAFVIGTLLLAVSVLSFVLTALQSRSLQRNGVHAVGTVTAVDGGAGGAYTIEVSYVAAGRTLDQPVVETSFGH